MTVHSIVIPTLGNHPVFFEAMASVLKHRGKDAEVLLVCNAPAAPAAAVGDEIARRFPEIRFLVTPRAFGIARACNLGLKSSSGEYVTFMHDDVLIHGKGWLEELKEVLDSRPDVGMVGGSEAKFIDRPAGDPAPFWKDVRECDWSPTVSMARRATLEAGCAFDEEYEVGLEDMDWALAFRRKGLKVAFRRVDHTHVGTKGSYALFLENKPLLDYYSRQGVRERYFLAKNRDVLSVAFVEKGLKKWGRRDRDWRKTWWMKLYLRYYVHRLATWFRGAFALTL